MDSSYNVIRRFTPPTCTLEILQKSPARYFWQPKQATEDYQFKLSFDDPRLFEFEGEAVSLSGDQNKLDRLCHLVSTYIEDFLARSFHDPTSAEVFSFQLSASELADDELVDDELSMILDPNLEDSKLVDQAYSLPELVNHRLNFDSVDSDADLASISLSATQLFDLGSALDDYQEAMLVLAQEQKQPQPKQAVFSGKVKALIGLSAIALGLLGSRLFMQSRLQNQIASRQQEVANPADLKVGADVFPPQVSESAKRPVAKVTETPSLRDRERLPPPPAVTTPKPPPNIPDPAKFPPPVGSLSVPPWIPLPSQKSPAGSSSAPTPSSAQAGSNKANSRQAGLDNNQVEATIKVSPQTAKKKDPGVSSAETKSPQTTVIEPDTQISDAQTKNSQTNNPQTNNSQIEIARLARTQKSSAQESLASQEQPTSSPALAGLPRQSRASQAAQAKLKDRANLENQVALEDEARPSRPQPNESSVNLDEQLALQERKGAAADSKSNLLRPNDNFTSKSSGNSGELVQLQEINSYFRNKWRSPEELRQTLEYRLILNQDGSIKRIIPLGKAAGIYLDRTNIPLRGEPFVSPFAEQDIVTVRLLLSPDGEVRTFLE